MLMVEVARNTVRGHEAQADFFGFLLDNFIFLDETTQPVANLHLHFLLHLTEFLGFLPGGFFCEATPFFDLQFLTRTGPGVHRAPGIRSSRAPGLARTAYTAAKVALYPFRPVSTRMRRPRSALWNPCVRFCILDR